jgi:hypothetical protein
MAVSIGGAPNMVELFDGDTIGDWTNSNRLSLDGFNSEIEGAGCVAISLAKNSNVTYSHTAPAGINIPEDTDADLGTREQVPSAAITGEYKGQAIINSYTTIGGILNAYSITLNDEQSPTAGTATFDILPEFTGATSSLILKSFVATAFDLRVMRQQILITMCRTSTFERLIMHLLISVMLVPESTSSMIPIVILFFGRL